ncbi:hypothetical protein LAD22_23200 [Escherichia coli]|uniref:hypothetical protein n=1 Tax=Escherichia coli TaxID=562 RepID=UPI00226D7ED4|nr:hypothetical protein [Escherichia coli]MCX9910840.1 hypothetical protein [Escherichia coli]
MKNRKKFWIPFLFVCLCGLFILLAGGVKWGTVGCGFWSGVTLFAAWLIANFESGGGYW